MTSFPGMTHFRTKPYIFKRYQRILRYHLRPQRMLKKRLHRKCRQINTESTRSLLHRQCVYHNGWVLVHDVDWFLISSSRTNKTGDELQRQVAKDDKNSRRDKSGEGEPLRDKIDGQELLASLLIRICYSTCSLRSGKKKRGGGGPSGTS